MELKDVKERVCQLEGAIKRLDSVRKHLSRNAHDIKTEIHASVSRNLECLRGREVSLLGAVDHVLAVKEDTLQAQQARLNQALGVLTTTSLSIAADKGQILADTLHQLDRLELSPEETPHISFRADHLGLRETILSYGRVDAGGLPLATAFEDPSKPSASLPRQLEEYEDAEHHFFYKPVSQQGGCSSGQGPVTSINVTIPRLSTRVEDWLQKKGPSSTAVSRPSATDMTTGRFLPAASRPSSLPQRVRERATTTPSTPGSSCSLNNWLSLIKQHADLEEEHNFEIIDNTSTPLGQASSSSPCKMSPVARDFFGHIKKDLKLWLQPTSQGVTTAAATSFSDDFFKNVSLSSKVWLAKASTQLRALTAVGRNEEKIPDPFAHISKRPEAWLQSQTADRRSSNKVWTLPEVTRQKSLAFSDFFSHISRNQDDWLIGKATTPRKPEASEASGQDGGKSWLASRQSSEAEPSRVAAATSFELEDVCRANELCCSMSECVSKPDCVAMYFCSDSALSSPSSASGDKNTRTSPPQSTQAEGPETSERSASTPAPSSFAVSSPVGLKISGVEDGESEAEKLALDTLVAEKEEKYDGEEGKEDEEGADASRHDFFHMIPKAGDPVWLLQPAGQPGRVKVTKEEKNLWLQKVQPADNLTEGSPDALFHEWIVSAKAAAGASAVGYSHGGKADGLTSNGPAGGMREKEDSEGWSIVSDTFSVQSEQHELDVATADDYINKWLL